METLLFSWCIEHVSPKLVSEVGVHYLATDSLWQAPFTGVLRQEVEDLVNRFMRAKKLNLQQVNRILLPDFKKGTVENKKMRKRVKENTLFSRI